MISLTRGIFSTNLWKPKIIHSLEYLKYLYTVLIKNPNITEQNKDLLVEVFRLVAEILIWGDQNDSSIIDFFLEKNILSLFLKFLNQQNGEMIYKQLLQTLSIMFENISDKTSIYYLLSNNHINAIICHKFDFNDEEIMAYYISFLKALSMKLNKHTINFFFNENTNDFALLTESIKFSNQSESMVRTAVRNITLNVFKVADKAMLRYITDKIALPYFHNLTWFIGNNVMELDACLAIKSNTLYSGNRFQTIVDEHLDHLQYINDILGLNVESLNGVLIEALLNKLLIPLYVYSLSRGSSHYPDTHSRPHVSAAVSMLMLSQVFLIIKHRNAVQFLATIILNGDLGICINGTTDALLGYQIVDRKFEAPTVGLVETLENIKGVSPSKLRDHKSKTTDDSVKQSENHVAKSFISHVNDSTVSSAPVTPRHRTTLDDPSNNNKHSGINSNIDHHLPFVPITEPQSAFSLKSKPFLKTIFQSLEFEDDKVANDYEALLAMCLLFAICQNPGVDESVLNSCGLTSKSSTKSEYNRPLMDRLISVFDMSVKYGSTIRLATLELACILAETLVCSPGQCSISDEHFAYILTAYEESKLLLRNYYKSEEIFVNMFEDEYISLQKRPLNLEFLLMDSAILMPDFVKTLPTNDIERARYFIRVFLLLRQLCDQFKVDDDVNDVSGDNSIVTYPFNPDLVSIGDNCDLTTKDVVDCIVDYSGKCERKSIILDEQQIILVEPDSKRAGWGFVTFVGFLQHIRIMECRDDNKCLFINIYNHTGAIALQSHHSSNTIKMPIPIFTCKFIFDDHVSCTLTQKRLEKGREMTRQLKLQYIALMLDFPTNVALGIKSEPSNNDKEYRSGYFGPKEIVPDNTHTSWEMLNSNKPRSKDGKSNIHDNRATGSSTDSELHIKKLYFN